MQISKWAVIIAIVGLILVSSIVAGCTNLTSTQSGASSTPVPSQASAQATVRPTAALPTMAPTNIQSYTGPFVGSKNSNVYHYPWCYEVKKIKPENLVTFNTVTDACAANYRPCEVCNPPACGVTTSHAPTPQPKIATDTTIYVPPVDMGGGHLNGGEVKQGQFATIAVVINAIDGTHPCSPAVSYYIDNQAAFGVWYIPPNPTPGSCSGGVMPHMELQLANSDTAKLSLGTHTFIVDYLGDSAYGPSQSITQFTVVK